MQTFPAANPFVRWFHYHYNRLTPKNQVGFAFFAEKGRNVPRRATAVAFERIRRGREPRTRCLREVRDALAGRGLDARRFSALPLNSRPVERKGRLHRMAGIAGMTPLRTVIPRGSRCTRSSRQKGRTARKGWCDLFGGNKRARTSDPLLVRQMLSQLSYAPDLIPSFDGEGYDSIIALPLSSGFSKSRGRRTERSFQFCHFPGNDAIKKEMMQLKTLKNPALSVW